MTVQAEGEARLVVLTEAQMDHIAERAAKRVFDRIYSDIGKGVLRKLTWLVGLVSIGLLGWLAGKGIVPK